MILLNKCFKDILKNRGGFTKILSLRGGLSLRNAHTAAVIVIGDEILKGQVRDTNTQFFARELYNRGYTLKNVITLPDDIKTISNTIRDFSFRYDIVLTSGGIGPTHDDVTYEALAHAFKESLYYHPQIVEMCKIFFKTDDEKHPSMKLAHIPISAKLTFGVDKATGKTALYPNVSLKNVFIFPGVPHLCQRMFNFNKDELFPVVGKFYTSKVFIDANESDITAELNDAVKKFPNIIFGSYPTFFHSYYKVKITLESQNHQEISDGVEFLKLKIESVINFDENCFLNKMSKLKALNNEKLNYLIDNISDFVKTRQPDNLYLYLDGGKNSILILHILSAILENNKINLIHVDTNLKVTQYVEKLFTNYNCNFMKLSENNFKRFLNVDKSMVLVKGTRKSDPKFNEISSYFNNLNMFNPILNWDYFEIWDIVRKLNLPYCDLYDQGYSSLNGPINTSLVLNEQPSGLIFYKKAHLLEDKRLE